MKITGMRAVQAVRESLEASGLGRTSGYSGGELSGWIASNRYGSTGFSVRKEKDGTLGWHVVISGKPHLSYRKWTERNDDDTIELHEPRDPERLFSKVSAAFEAVGIEVLKVDFGGAQMHWDDDVSYNVSTKHPEWLGAPDTDNKPQAADGPVLKAMAFAPRTDAIAPGLGAPLVGYVHGESAYLTRESLVALVAATERAESSRKETAAWYTDRKVPVPRDLATRRLIAALSQDGELLLSVPNRSEVRSRPVTLTNHWGDEVEAWKMPTGMMKPLDAFKPGVTFVLDGETRDSVPFKTLDAQYGGEAPWLEEMASAPSPR